MPTYHLAMSLSLKLICGKGVKAIKETKLKDVRSIKTSEKKSYIEKTSIKSN